MAYRRKPTARNRTGSVDKNAERNSAVTSLSLPNIAELITEGEITVGVLHPPGTRLGAASVLLNLDRQRKGRTMSLSADCCAKGSKPRLASVLAVSITKGRLQHSRFTTGADRLNNDHGHEDNAQNRLLQDQY